MNLPSTEELQRLLDEATPGEWEPRSDPDWGFIDIHGVQSQDGEPVCIDGTPQDCIVLALAPVLAAEVIRLREGIANAQSKLDYYAGKYQTQGESHTSARIRDVSEDLARVVEGDQT